MKKYILLISSIISIWLTSYLSLLPLNGNSQADISNLYNTSITPAWFTFSIWSIIYLSWIILWFYLIYNKNEIKKKKIILLSAAQLTSMIWLFPWHYNMVGLSVIIMLWLLWILSLLVIKRNKNKVFQGISDFFFWWILVATIVNIHTFLIYVDIYIYPIILWVVSLIIWWIINIIIIHKYKTIIPSIVFIWALFWIISKQADVSIISSSYIIWFIVLSIMLKNIFQNKKTPLL